MTRHKPFDSICRIAATECIGLAVRKSARALGQYYDDALAPCGIRGTQFSLLVALSLMDRPQVTELASALVMDRTTLTRNLRLLERDGLIDVEAGSDRRTRTVCLKAAGRRSLHRALPLWHRAHRDLLQSIGENRATRLRKDLANAVDAVSD